VQLTLASANLSVFGLRNADKVPNSTLFFLESIEVFKLRLVVSALFLSLATSTAFSQNATPNGNPTPAANAGGFANAPVNCDLMGTEQFFELTRADQMAMLRYCPDEGNAASDLNSSDQSSFSPYLNNQNNKGTDLTNQANNGTDLNTQSNRGNDLNSQPNGNNPNYGDNRINRADVNDALLNGVVNPSNNSRNLNQLDSINQVLGPNRVNRPTAGNNPNALPSNQYSEARPNSTRKVNVTNRYFERFGLKPFGYEMFRSATTALVPGTDLPAPDNYKLAPGDAITIETYGQTTRTYKVPVDRDGSVNVPDLGPVSVQGLDAGSAKMLLESRVKSGMLGTSAKVSVSELHSSRVLVVGDAEQPGSYVLTGLPNVTAALLASGGVLEIGSLRKVELRRDGKTVRHLDIYSELLNGDTSNDVQVLPGDAILIPTVGPTIGVAGEVLRPAVYELLNERTIAEVVKLAGGFTPGSDPSHAVLDRIDSGKHRVIENVDLTKESELQKSIRAGDLLTIPPITSYLANQVQITGAVLRPGVRAAVSNLKIADVLPSLTDLAPTADSHYVLIRRLDLKTQIVSTLSTDLEAAISNPSSKWNIELKAADQIVVFDKFKSRKFAIAKILSDLQRQSTPEKPAAVFSIAGQVNANGTYPLDTNMHVSDAIRAGGGLKDSAYRRSAELTRFQIINGEKRVTSVIRIDLQSVIGGNAESDIVLQPYDQLNIQVTPGWNKNESVQLVGEVQFPGTYTITPGETLSSVIKRAGGFTNLAFLKGAIFTREDLRRREAEQKSKLLIDLRASMASQAAAVDKSNPLSAATLASSQAALQQLEQVEPLGRMVIDLPELSKTGRLSNKDVTLRNNDRLVVPRMTEEVTILGEVQNQTAVQFYPGLTKNRAIADAGGFTRRADKSNTYVIRANGQVVTVNHSFYGKNQALEPGDSVIVPTDVASMNPLVRWSTISQMVFQFATTAASLKVVGVL